MSHFSIEGSGLGLRAEFMQDIIELESPNFNFMEIAPENWMEIGGWRKEQLEKAIERKTIVAHGLNLSIGAPIPLNLNFIEKIKCFLNEWNITLYSEHLSYCSDEKGYLYDLLPIPFTDESVRYISQRIRQVQDFLEMKIAFENSSYYYQFEQSLDEVDFINAVISESDCLMLLDINNVYVNGFNHGYDPVQFISKLPSEKIAYIHVAGHWQKSDDLIIDTHGEAVKSDVWDILKSTYQKHGVLPTLLERDSDIPPLATLLKEVDIINHLQSKMSTS